MRKDNIKIIKIHLWKLMINTLLEIMNKKNKYKKIKTSI